MKSVGSVLVLLQNYQEYMLDERKLKDGWKADERKLRCSLPPLFCLCSTLLLQYSCFDGCYRNNFFPLWFKYKVDASLLKHMLILTNSIWGKYFRRHLFFLPSLSLFSLFVRWLDFNSVVSSDILTLSVGTLVTFVECVALAWSLVAGCKCWKWLFKHVLGNDLAYLWKYIISLQWFIKTYL